MARKKVPNGDLSSLVSQMRQLLDRITLLEEENRNLRVAMELEGDEAKKKMVSEFDNVRHERDTLQQMFTQLQSQLAAAMAEAERLRAGLPPPIYVPGITMPGIGGTITSPNIQYPYPYTTTDGTWQITTSTTKLPSAGISNASSAGTSYAAYAVA